MTEEELKQKGLWVDRSMSFAGVDIKEIIEQVLDKEAPHLPVEDDDEEQQ